MWKSDTFNNAIRQLEERNLGPAVKELENYFLGHPTHPEGEAFRTLASHYQLLTDYWLSGYDDADRQRLFSDLLHHFYVLVSRLVLGECNRRTAFRLTLMQMAVQHTADWSVEHVKSELENYVSEQALLSLEAETEREAKLASLYSRHQQFMSHLFSHLWTSEMWHSSDADGYRDILLSPTVDTIDQQLLVSAITLAALNTFDIHKFRTMATVYQQSTDEQVRQRALVGWALVAADEKTALYPEVQAITAMLCDDEHCREELAELQMQLVYCIDADADSRRIREEIMPDLLSHSNIKVTQHGLVEQEEDTLEEILHPDTAERHMEKMEESMKKMMAMQQQGSDIYFGGFSQMKRFPFFNDVSNWLVPFYPNHPAISRIWHTARSRNFLHIITKVGAFCNSDKYSFVLAFDQVVSRLPKSMLDMIDKGEAVPTPVGGEIAEEEQRKPAFVRRMYLQDLYRFFKLFSMRGEFRNPFAEANAAGCLFFGRKLFSTTALQSHYVQIAAFLAKRKMNGAAKQVLQCCDEQRRDFQYYMMMGMLIQREAQSDDQLHRLEDCYRSACRLNADSERACYGLARTLFARHEYAESQQLFALLSTMRPDHLAYELGCAACLLNMNRSEEALKTLFRLSYDHPDDQQVERTLAWALTLSGRYEQAMKHYDRLLADKPQPDDWLNCGYCLWFQRRNREAAEMFRRLRASENDFDFGREFLQADLPFLAEKGIKEVEVRLMLDQLLG